MAVGSTAHPLPPAAGPSGIPRPAHPHIGHSHSSDEDDSDSDHAPLFDPSGLSSSAKPSRDGTFAGIDLNSHAAVRLGLSPPPPTQRSPSQPLLQRSHSSFRSASEALQPPSHSSVPRGRRRRSSENLDAQQQDSAQSSLHSQRGVHGQDLDSSSAKLSQIPRLDVKAARLAEQGQFSRPSSLSPSTSSYRSPAADFLSTFSSLNSMVGTAAPGSESRGSSLSATRSREPSTTMQSSASRAENAPPADRLSNSFQGLGGAAAELMTQTNSSEGLNPPSKTGFDPEEMGSRFGPGDRFELGRLVGFGGFSTIREGLDESEGRKRPIAVKLIYVDASDPNAEDSHEQELTIWRSLPAHPHLLPLLYDERRLCECKDSPDAPMSPSNSQQKRQQTIQLLVMPFCEGGNLLDYVRSEGGRRSGSGSSISLSRSQSLTKSPDSVSTSPSSSPFQSRPVSGVISQRNLSGPPPSSLTRGTGGTGSIRRGSGALPRSQGVSIGAAREVLKQLADALYCLHHKMKVLHGDLKLENVLAQTSLSEGAAQQKDLDTSISTCWQLADFGLSHKVVPGDEKSGTDRAGFFKRNTSRTRLGKGKGSGEAKGTLAQRSASRPGGRAASKGGGGGGGSLAYTPPELWRERTAAVSPSTEEIVISPFASDMWALGCIAYALLSGKMPFNDSFEPRLQAKIAKGDWELPPRLWRRAKRLATAAAQSASNTSGGAGSLHSRSISGRMSGSHERSSLRGSFGSYYEPDRSTNRSLTGQAPSANRFALEDLSASLPSLSDAEHKAARIYNHDMAAAHDAPVVGSVPTRPDAPQRYDIDVVAQAVADAEADPDSDLEQTIDQMWDGNSSERAAARAVLRGLLEPEPRKRWTVEQLLASRWLSGAMNQDTNSDPAGRARALPNVTEGVALGEEHLGAQQLHGESKRPQWGREKSWRSELTFDRIETSAKTEERPERVKRPSSLTRSRPIESNRDGRAVSPGSRSGSRPRRSPSSSRGDIPHADASVVIHDGGRGSPSSSIFEDGTTRSGSASPSISRRSTPSLPTEIRGRRPRAQPSIRGVNESEALLHRKQSQTLGGENPASTHQVRASTADTTSQGRSLSTSRLGYQGGRPLARPSSSSSMTSSSSSTAVSNLSNAAGTGAHRPPRADANAKTKRNRSRPPVLSYFGTSFGASSGGGGRYGSAVGSPTDHRGSPTVSSFTESSTRSSTSRSRSRAPDALAHLLGSNFGSNNTPNGSAPANTSGHSTRYNGSGSPSISRSFTNRDNDRFSGASGASAPGSGAGSPRHFGSRGHSLSNPIAVPGRVGSHAAASSSSSHIAEFAMDEDMIKEQEEEEEDRGRGRGRTPKR